MSLIIVAFKSAPMPTAASKDKDDRLNEEIRKKTIGKFSLSNKDSSTKIRFALNRNLPSRIKPSHH
jgi:hypothetical protein